MTRSRSLFSLFAVVLTVGFATAASARTADGETPAVEDICTKWGLSGQVNGL